MKQKFIAIILLVGYFTASGQKNIDGLVKSERGFAAYALSHGVKPAFLLFADTTGIMYDRGKISESEKLLVSNIAIDLVLMTKFVSTTDTPKLRAYSIIVSGSEEATYLARIASVTLHLMGWHSLYLGNVENKIDPFFDIDIQRLISKKLKNVNGLSAVMIFSFNANTLKFLSNTVNALRKKIENNLRIAVYTNNDLLQVSHEMDVDYSTTELKALIDWAKDEYRNTLP